jgi:cytoskeletal protein RodZ
MTDYDAGPGDRSDRSWEDPERKQRPQARRRRVTLPPWALLAIFIGIVILLCIGLVLIINAIRGDDEETGTPSPTVTSEVAPSATVSLLTPTAAITPTATVVLTVGTPPATTPPTEIRPGALVVVTGTQGAGLRLRGEATTSAGVVTTVKEGTVLTVLDGPSEGDGYTWWQVRTPDGEEGWGAADWLVLKTEE